MTGSTMARSRISVPSPNAPCASIRALRRASGKAAASSTSRHAASAAAGDGLDHHGKSDFFLRRHHGMLCRRPDSRARWEPAFSNLLGAGLLPIALIACGDGPMNTSPASWQVVRIFVFGEKAIAGMDRAGARALAAAMITSSADRIVTAAPRRSARPDRPRGHATHRGRRRNRPRPRRTQAGRVRMIAVQSRRDGDENLKNGVAWFPCAFMAAPPRTACAAACAPRPPGRNRQHLGQTLRVSRGSITPSSSTRAEVENTSIWSSNTPVICAFIASSFFPFSIGLPRLIAAASDHDRHGFRRPARAHHGGFGIGQEKQKARMETAPAHP